MMFKTKDVIKNHNVRILLVAALLISVFASFGLVYAESATLVLDQTDLTLFKGKSVQLKAELAGTEEKVKLEWESSDKNVATVNSNGNVIAKDAGNTVIQCRAVLTDGTEIEADCNVTVNIAVTSINSKKQNIFVYAGEKADPIELTISPSTATDATVNWSSSDESIATVDENGVISGIKSGTTSIIATTKDGSNKSCKITVSVRDSVQSIHLDKNTAEVAKGKTLKLNTEILPDTAFDKKLKWSSSDNTIATVSNGTITGKKAGKVTITAEAADGNGAFAQCEVEVITAVTAISPESKAVTVNEGKVLEPISLAFTPKDATCKDVLWESADPTIAVVDERGIIRGVSVGKTSVTVTSQEKVKTPKTTSIAVEVTKPVERITLDTTDFAVIKGKSVKIAADVWPENASNQKITWSSSDKSVATVINGEVSAKAAGTAIITAEASDGSGVTAECSVTVTQPVTQITPSKKSLTLVAGNSERINVKIEPANASNKGVTWKSSNPAVAFIDNDGWVTAKKEGKATFTVSATDGSGKSAQITVTVTSKGIIGEWVARNDKNYHLHFYSDGRLVLTMYSNIDGRTKTMEGQFTYKTSGNNVTVTSISMTVYANGRASRLNNRYVSHGTVQNDIFTWRTLNQTQVFKRK